MTTSLDSSFLQEASYDDSTHTLTVVFNDGRTYRYQNVDRSTYQSLINADSAGRFFSRNIAGKFTTDSQGS